MAVSLSSVSELLVQLLRLHHRVSLSGMGAFVTEYQPAELIRGGKGMLPPTKNVTFSTAELWNDGFLEEALAGKQKISPDEARQALSQFVQELQTLLKTGKRVEFPGFGTLRITGDGTYLFEKDENTNLLPDAFGLLELDVTPLPEREEMPEPVVPSPALAAPAAPMAPLTPLTPLSTLPPLTPLTPPTKSTPVAGMQKKNRRCRSVCWIILAVVLLAIAALVALSVYRFEMEQRTIREQFTTPVIPAAPQPMPAVPVDTLPAPTPKKAFPAPPTPPQKATPAPATRPAVKPAIPAESKRMNQYHIMLGAYETKAEAEAAMNRQLNGNGCSCQVLHTGGQKPYKVSAYRYTTNGEAAELLSVFKTTDSEYARAWVEKF